MRGEESRILAGELESLLIIDGDCSGVLQVLDEAISDYPNDARFPTSKAYLHLYDLDDLEEALRRVDRRS